MQREQAFIRRPRIEARRDCNQAGKGRDQKQGIESDSNRADAVAEHERRAIRNFVGQNEPSSYNFPPTKRRAKQYQCRNFGLF